MNKFLAVLILILSTVAIYPQFEKRQLCFFTGSWYEKYVAFSEKHNLIIGKTKGNFEPSSPINRAEMAKVIVGIWELMQGKGASEELSSVE